MRTFKSKYNFFILSGFFLCCCLTFFVFSSPAKAGDVAITSDVKFVNITPYLDYLEDPKSSYDITDVSSGQLFKEFSPLNRSIFHQGLTSSTWWLKVRLGIPQANNQKFSQTYGWASKWLIEIPKINMGNVTFYIPDFTKQNGFQQVEVHKQASLKYNKMYLNTVYPLTSSIGGKTIFIKIKSNWPVSAPIYIWEESTYRKAQVARGLGFGVGCGLFFASILFVILSTGLDNKQIGLKFLLYASSWLIFLNILRGYSLLLDISNVQLAQFLPQSLCFIGFSTLILSIQILNLKLYSPKFFVLAKAFLSLFIILFPISFILPPTLSLKLAVTLIILLGICKVALCLSRMRQGFRPALWYLMGTLIMSLTLLIFFVDGIFWPSFIFNDQLPIWGGGVSIIFTSVAINMITGVNEFKKMLIGDKSGKPEPYDISTGLYSKTYFVSRFTEEMNHCQRVQQPLCLLLIDLDNLKIINEKYGLLFADQVIVSLGEIIKANANQFSAGGRLDGGHFALQLSEKSLKDALIVAEKIEHDFSSLKFNVEDYLNNINKDEQRTKPEILQFTVCIGVVEIMEEDSQWEDVFERATRELTQAKETGLGNISPHPSIKGLF